MANHQCLWILSLLIGEIILCTTLKLLTLQSLTTQSSLTLPHQLEVSQQLSLLICQDPIHEEPKICYFKRSKKKNKKSKKNLNALWEKTSSKLIKYLLLTMYQRCSHWNQQKISQVLKILISTVPVPYLWLLPLTHPDFFVNLVMKAWRIKLTLALSSLELDLH